MSDIKHTCTMYVIAQRNAGASATAGRPIFYGTRLLMSGSELHVVFFPGLSL